MMEVRFFSTTPMTCFLTVLAAGAGSGQEGKQRPDVNLLTSRYSQEFILQRMMPRDAWEPFPRAADREAWDALQKHPLGRKRKAYLTSRAGAMLGQPWPSLPATLYMEFVRVGNRSRYQAPYFQRRENLATLVLAECMEHEGRFLDEIADGIWAICEESTWCIPAHAVRHRGDALPRPDVHSLDLFACETGMSLAGTHYLLRQELDSHSPALCQRIRLEVARRIIDPYAAGDDFGSSGWTRGYNNWAPWCASNVMGAAMLLEEDPKRLAGVVFRLMQVVDRFINRYGDDGGCDEGPSYWNEAAGAMLTFLELLHSRTGGAVDPYDHPKIAAMGRFITRAHIAGPWFANFADADPQPGLHPGKVYRFGARVGSDELKNLALLSMRGWKAGGPVDPPVRLSGVTRPVLGPLMELFWVPADGKPGRLGKEDHAWLPDLQVLFARESTDSDEGLVLAAKGGHNAESHNHNDVGHFILFLDGQPGIIDLGRETYTRQTFSSRRYELWFTRGSGHNVPLVNGLEQQPGSQYRATEVRFEERGPGAHLGLNLERAYPEKAGIESLRREFEFRRGADAHVTVRDTFELTGGPVKIVVPMFAALEAAEIRPGRLSIACRPRPLVLEYDPETLKVAVEVVPIEDENLREGWGERIYRVAFTYEGPGPAGSYAFRFHPGSP